MSKGWTILVVALFLATAGILYLSYSGNTPKSPVIINYPNQNNMRNTLTLSSSAFKDGEMIPSLYTCEGKNIIPPLTISGVPISAESLALIMDDPDAPSGTFVHWVKWNISTSTSEIKEGVEPDGVSGVGGSGSLTYIGPCPPSGTHHYHFKMYALDTELPLVKRSTKAELESAMSGHIIDQTELVGLYQKKN